MKKAMAVSILLLLVLPGCKKEKDSYSHPRGNPMEFFPMYVGMSWIYSIEVGTAKPLRYEEIHWPRGEGGLLTATRGFFMGAFDGSKKEFLLKLKIKALATKQGRLQYPIGVELEIEKDELGFFDDQKQVFFAATTSSGLMVHLVVTRSPNSPGAPSGGAWGGWGSEDGYTMPIVFFVDRPGIQISMGKNPSDSLTFLGEERSPSNGFESLHFRREVKADDRKPGEEGDYLKKGFTEDTWYARGKGLVHLVQKVDGEISMTWKLVGVSKF